MDSEIADFVERDELRIKELSSSGSKSELVREYLRYLSGNVKFPLSDSVALKRLLVQAGISSPSVWL